MRTKLLSTALFIATGLLHGQSISYEKTLQLNSTIEAFKTVFTGDGSSITAASNFPSGSAVFTVFKLDSADNLLWTHTYASSDLDRVSVKDIRYTRTNEIILAVTGKVTSPDNNKAGLIKLDSSGNIVWAKFYAPPLNQGKEFNYFAAANQAPDSTYFLVTESREMNTQVYTPVTTLIHLDQNGDEIWTKQLDTLGSLPLLFDLSAYGSINICGMFGPTCVVTLDTQGTVIQAQSYTSSLFNNPVPRAWIMDTLGRPELMACNNFTSAGTFTNILKFDTNGTCTQSENISQVYTEKLIKTNSGYIGLGSKNQNTETVIWPVLQTNTTVQALKYTSVNYTYNNFIHLTTDSSILVRAQTLNFSNGSTAKLLRTYPISSNSLPAPGCGFVSDTVSGTPGQFITTPVTISVYPYSVVNHPVTFSSLNFPLSVDSDCELILGVEEYVQNPITVFPVPASKQINITSSFTEISLVQIFSTAGTLVLSEAPSTALSALEINTGNLPTGLYLMQITTANGQQQTQKIIVVQE
ncbi:MAG: T9SS type A sorting domain-containing protein [Bacteroidia bacterium]|jgi:hypothetical protein|nr:T9SS type A sorting domain-containing protein [Bacteroidia bacterium]